MAIQSPRPLTIKPGDLSWLGDALGIHTVSQKINLDDLIHCLPSMSLTAYPKGSSIVKEGEQGEDIFIVYKGEVQVSRDGRGLGSLSPGDFFGEVGFLVGAPRTATVTAGEDAQVFRIKAKDFDEVVVKCPPLMDALRAKAKKRMDRLR